MIVCKVKIVCKKNDSLQDDSLQGIGGLQDDNLQGKDSLQDIVQFVRG